MCPFRNTWARVSGSGCSATGRGQLSNCILAFVILIGLQKEKKKGEREEGTGGGGDGRMHGHTSTQLTLVYDVT